MGPDRGPRPALVLATAVDGSEAAAMAAAVGVAAAARAPGAGVLVAEVGPSAPRRPTLLSSAAAGELEAALRAAGIAGAAARGSLCWLSLPPGEEGLQDLPGAIEASGTARLVIVVVAPGVWQRALAALPAVDGALIRARLPDDKALAALAVGELHRRGVRARVVTRPLGRVAARRAVAGLASGGAASGRLARLARALVGDSGQAMPLALGSAFAVVFVALVLAAIGGAVSGAARVQRAADLGALSAARSLRDDLPRALAPARLPDGSLNRAHLGRAEYLGRAVAAAREAAVRNGVPVERVRVSFPGSGDFPPIRARVAVRAEAGGSSIGKWAEAEAVPAGGWSGTPERASGGGYAGPLAYRQGEPMRPDVAVAFDRLAAAARRAGFALVITSGYRSDAEQARLFAQNPDPRWVAPPGRSLHRCATELDLGPPAAYGWLAANARRFGFLRRYPWE